MRKTLALLVVLLVLGADRVTKTLAAQALRFAPPRELLGGLVRLVYAENTGAFLSLGASLPEAVRFTIFGLAVAIGLAVASWYLLKDAPASVGRAVLVALIVGGGIGNLVDRILNHGRVVDFVIVGLGPVRTGVFNVADMAITAGVIGIALESLVGRKRQRSAAATSSEA